MTYNYADIILPVAVRGRFTYSIPAHLAGIIKPGSRALVPFGKKRLYSGIVCKLHNEKPDVKNIKPVYEIAGPLPLVNEIQVRHWQWISDYYMCSEGEVLKAAVPSALFPSGDTSSPVTGKFKPKEEIFVHLGKDFTEKEMNEILDSLKKAPRQSDILTSFLYLKKYDVETQRDMVSKSLLLREAGSGPGNIEPLVRKGILSIVSKEVGRLEKITRETDPINKLSDNQLIAFNKIQDEFKQKEIVLLHGITSSGKTEIYIHLIEEQMKLGKQVLYLLPEIALTLQIIHRLQRHFGQVTGVYHSRFNDQERAEIWNRVGDEDASKSYRIILGVRSSVFLPFNNLGLVIVDEEHEGSYKQHDPAPRYHARDTAIVLAGMHKAKTLLGSASPSVESYYNTLNGKYGLVELKERFGQIRLPSIVIANTREAYRKKLMVSHFTPELLSAMDEALGKNEQIILFQNRRGFSPYIECQECGWIPVCDQCAVNMTYHKSISRLVCHYCGRTTAVPSRCVNCSAQGMSTRGFGTEKIEDEIKIVFPAARIQRMDQDTTKNKNSFVKLIRAFEEQRIDILIGTQMISKGLDFENLTVVGILNADNMLNFPDFRAHERSFQLMEQVSGRAGRRQKQGKVVIQTFDPAHKIIRLIIRHDYLNMYKLQAEERKTFNYPPFCRMIRISLKHKDKAALNSYADLFGKEMRGIFGQRVLGPEFPVISQIQLWYIKNIIIKIERERPLTRAKEMIQESVLKIEKEPGAGGLRIAVDVDPY